MRTIKFRGKRVDGGQWIEGDLIHYREGITYILPQLSGDWDILEGGLEIDSNTIGQFVRTDLYNGKETPFYCGDIVRLLIPYGTNNPYKAQIFYDESMCSFRAKIFRNNEIDIENLTVLNIIEVIGNIHDNPDPC